MDKGLAKWFRRIAATALLTVWFAGPLGAVAQGWLRPAHVHCHCPGHHHKEPTAPGPTFAPCDHEARANVSAADDRLLILSGDESPFEQQFRTVMIPTSSAKQGPSYLPETPPPKAYA